MADSNLPRHVAIIMDGNGRWAQSRGRPRAAGHQSGFHATRDIVEYCGRLGIGALTMFAFSSENWRRPADEVSRLMDLFLSALKTEVNKLHANNVSLRFIGDLDGFSRKLQAEMLAAEQKTRENAGLRLSIAVNYGGRWDIVNAARAVAQKVAAGDMKYIDITPETFSQNLTLSDCPEPDLFIRTGGEQRISNYLLWQLAYTELYFTDVLWPDFNADEFDRALAFFSSRQRRFGRTGEQVAKQLAGKSEGEGA